MIIYDLTVEMDIKRKQFSVHGNISGLKAFTEYSFLLYSKTTHLSIRSKGNTIFYKTELYEKEQALPECLKIQITTKEEGKLEVDYVCQLEESHNPLNQLNNRCVELGLYCPWYPMLKTLDSAMFKIEISGLKEYTVLNAKKVGDLQIINYENQTDAYIIAFKKPYVFSYSQERMNVSIICQSEQGADIGEMLVGHIERIYNYYKELYDVGKSLNNTREMTIVLFDREKGGGYYRDSLIVSSLEGRSNCQWIQFIAHEIAHQWWNRGDISSWEDWLNESMSEYSAWDYIENHTQYNLEQEVIQQYIPKIEQCAPIINMNKNSSHVYISRFKGAYILHTLGKTYGKDCVTHALRILLSLEEYTTEKWLKILGQQGYDDVAKDILTGIS